MACIVLFGGIPGSGKSTIIDNLLKQKKFVLSDLQIEPVSDNRHSEVKSLKNICCTQNKCYNVVSVSYDEISTLSEQQNLIDVPNGWKDFRKDFLDAVECYVCFLRCLKCEPVDISSRTKTIFDYLMSKYSSNNVLESQVVLLVEDNFYYSSMRYKWFQVCRKYNLGFCQVFLDCPLDIACKRNITRMTKVPENVIHIMSEKLEVPDVKKNQWEKFSFVYNTTKGYETFPINEVIELIRAAANNRPEPVLYVSEQKREAQVICSQNVIHQADKILRRLTGQVIKQVLKENRSKEDIKLLTSNINQVRQKLLKDLSEGTLLLPVRITDALRNCETVNKVAEAEEHLFILMKINSEILMA